MTFLMWAILGLGAGIIVVALLVALLALISTLAILWEEYTTW